MSTFPKPAASPPSILAPAGNRDAFLAALSAGTDSIYCGLKRFSARMEAKNFALEELTALTQLAHDKEVEVFVTVNTLLTPGELNEIGNLLERIVRFVKPDALIIQDLAVVNLARQVGFSGDLILSTLANVSFPDALRFVRKELGVDRVVIPRELTIDEIKSMACACPDNLNLEIFVHGALCYAVSGRCYWSSYLGGKSGLRGRCVQPCRRLYRQNNQISRSFSCKDLSLDVLVKVLLTIPQIRHWKIEGRKKGPHYVYYTVKAYRLLRDHGKDAQVKKEALGLLERSLGRPGTHYHFLPQRPQSPVSKDGQTASGLFVGKVRSENRKSYLIPRDELLAGDVLRIGYEDEGWHSIQKISKYVPRKGRIYFKPSSRDTLPKDTPVFLIDRRESRLIDMLSSLEKKLGQVPQSRRFSGTFHTSRHGGVKRKSIKDLTVYRTSNTRKSPGRIGYWLSPDTRLEDTPDRVWWWLPPVIWPTEETAFRTLVDTLTRNGGRHFVLNAPWQSVFFRNPKEFDLWAGPFCNITNPIAVDIAAALGFSGVILSPEMKREDYLLLPRQSVLPLGIVVSGNWPLCIARTVSEYLKTDIPFTSPKGEIAWIRKQDSNFWIYPNWILDLNLRKEEFKSAGYSLFVHLVESLPQRVTVKKRPGLWNWETGLL